MCNQVHRSAFEEGGMIVKENTPIQRKTTLKWSSNGELSPIDKARVLERLTNKELTECELSCEVQDVLGLEQISNLLLQQQ